MRPIRGGLRLSRTSLPGVRTALSHCPEAPGGDGRGMDAGRILRSQVIMNLGGHTSTHHKPCLDSLENRLRVPSVSCGDRDRYDLEKRQGEQWPSPESQRKRAPGDGTWQGPLGVQVHAGGALSLHVVCDQLRPAGQRPVPSPPGQHLKLLCAELFGPPEVALSTHAASQKRLDILIFLEHPVSGPPTVS
ncbi:PREDICTED: uncharacterized protein LOC109390812 isoform X2 [Hipposideros armiger]|uniref:Uncharacterized protein LOC109390812 isoform X2 n=1 Tax=Hipposideros armiger TaxID=186990 RepID=A0A8B7SIW0_HIPAR|nr:PREDICTED: uncharacterized protein LOC109390812 isoform X2 [Hipposideros armiger]